MKQNVNAIYLCTGNELLSAEELQKYPEVIVLHSFCDLQKLFIPRKVALIDNFYHLSQAEVVVCPKPIYLSDIFCEALWVIKPLF